MKLRAFILFNFFWVFFWFPSLAQKSGYYLHQLVTDYPNLNVEKVKLKEKKIDSLSIIVELDRIIKNYQFSAFLEATVDSIVFKDSLAYCFIHRGPEYKFAKLNIKDEFESILIQAGYNTRNINGKAFETVYISKFFNNVIKVLENNGYPFSNISFKNYSTSNGLFTADLYIDKGRYITMDTLNLYGLDIISKEYLQNYLQIRPGEKYNAQKILAIKSKINDLTFINLTSDPTLRFNGNRAIVNLKLQNIDASRFDFIIGILPNNKNNDRYTISGDLNFEVFNKLKQGEQLSIQFERLKPETQQLELKFQYPFLLNLPFGLDTEFKLFKNQTKNRDLNFSFGIIYQLKANNFLKAFWNSQSSRLIDIDTSLILQTGKLPSRLDVSITNFGVQNNWQALDYRFNPRRGYQIMLRGTAGQKKILPSNAIINLNSEKFDFSNAYDSLDLSSYQFQIDFRSKFFFPLMKRSTLLTSINLSKIIAENEVYENEYFLFGGNKQMRGFDEKSLSGEFYGIGTLEYRLLLSRNSFLSTFVDYGFRQNKYDKEFEWDNPYGAGAGFSLETGAGIFGISVAVGSQKGNPIDFRNIKTHMGFLSLF